MVLCMDEACTLRCMLHSLHAKHMTFGFSMFWLGLESLGKRMKNENEEYAFVGSRPCEEEVPRI